MRRARGWHTGLFAHWVARASTFLLAAALPAAVALAEPADGTLPRIMSLNVCTDQLVMELAAPGQIVSLSALSDETHISFHRDRAVAYPKNRGIAEEVFVARPDIVVTGAYSLHNTTQLLQALGVGVEVFDYTQTLDTIPGDIRRMGAVIGRTEIAEASAAAFEARLAALSRPVEVNAPTVLVYGQNGVVLGSGTLADTVIRAAGLRNLAAERGIAGMAPYPLELLVADRPDIILTSQPYVDAPALADVIARHPALVALPAVRRDDLIPPGAWSCGGPFTLEALEALRGLADQIAAKGRLDG
jgi:iron complex transport system substrate-binding protein